MSDITTEASTRASADTNLQNQVNSLNSSVSNGKTLVANAITGKGVATSPSDTFATMANKINQISSKDASEYKNAKSYLCSSNNSGNFLIPALGVVPILLLCFSKRGIDDSVNCIAAFSNFARMRSCWTMGYDYVTLDTCFSGYIDDGTKFTSNIPASVYATHSVRVSKDGTWQYYYEYANIYLTVIY